MTLAEQQLAVAIAPMQGLAQDLGEVKDTMRKLAEAVTKLAIVEERQVADRQALGRAFGEIEKLDGRIKSLELAQPLQKQSAAWVSKAVGLVLAAVLGAGISGVVRAPDTKAPSAQVGYP